MAEPKHKLRGPACQGWTPLSNSSSSEANCFHNARRNAEQARRHTRASREDGLLIGVYEIAQYLGLPCRIIRERLQSGLIEASWTPQGLPCASTAALSKYRIGPRILSGRRIERRVLRAVFGGARA
jgi:hypothetical protein